MSRSRYSGIHRSVLRLRELCHRAEGRHGLILDYIDADLLEAEVFEPQRFGGAVREIDNPAFYDGTTIVDADDDGLPVPQVGDLNVGPERKSRMSRSQVVHVESLSAGGFLAVELFSIPGGGADLIRSFFAGMRLMRGNRDFGWATSVKRPRDVRPLSRSQAGDAQKERQTSSCNTSHSVHLAYSSSFPKWPLRS